MKNQLLSLVAIATLAMPMVHAEDTTPVIPTATGWSWRPNLSMPKFSSVTAAFDATKQFAKDNSATVADWCNTVGQSGMKFVKAQHADNKLVFYGTLSAAGLVVVIAGLWQYCKNVGSDKQKKTQTK